MAVRIERDRDRRMAQALAHDLRMNSLPEQMRCVRMTEVVEPHHRQICILEKRSKVVADCSWVHGPTVRTRADQVMIFVSPTDKQPLLGLFDLVHREGFEGEGG